MVFLKNKEENDHFVFSPNKYNMQIYADCYKGYKTIANDVSRFHKLAKDYKQVFIEDLNKAADIFDYVNPDVKVLDDTAKIPMLLFSLSGLSKGTSAVAFLANDDYVISKNGKVIYSHVIMGQNDKGDFNGIDVKLRLDEFI